MKRKDKEIKSTLSIEELKQELDKLTEKRFRLTFKHRITPLGNALELRGIRRDIARLNTWIQAKRLREKELAPAKK